MADAVLAGFLDGVVVVTGALDDAGAGALAAGVEVLRAGDLGRESVQDAFLPVRGEKPQGRRPCGG